MKRTKLYWVFAMIAMTVTTCEAAVITNLLNGAALDSAAGWEGGVVPGENDIAVFYSTATTNLTWTTANDIRWGGLVVNTAASIYFRRTGDAKMYLGADGIRQTYGNIHIYIPLHLVADQTWDFVRAITFYSGFNLFLNNNTLTVTGTASSDYLKNFAESIVGPGTIVNSGFISIAANKVASDTDFIVEGGTLRFMNSAATARAKNIELRNMVTLNSNCSVATPCITEIEGDLIINGKVPQMSFWQTGAASSTILANRFNPVSGMTLIRGPAIGEYPTNYTGDAVARVNVLFRETPPMFGDPNGSGVTTPIVKDVVMHRTGSSLTYGEGFATYDPLHGLRLLDYATEYAHTIVDGQTELSNVLFTNSLAGPVEITLTQPLTTINSLSFNLVGASTNAGFSILGDPDTTLRINSGMMFAFQSLSTPRTTLDNQTIAVPNLDFNGRDGKIFLGTMAGNSNGTLTPAFNLQSSFTNVSENGVSFYSPTSASLYMNGDVTNTYKGKITLNNGVWVRFARTSANTAVLGTLVLNGGSCQLNNQIADDAHVVIHSGSFMVKTGGTNSGNGGAESFGTLTMFGGSYGMGGDGGGGVSTISNVWIHGGAFTQNRSTSLYVMEEFLISGGQYTIRTNSDSSRSGPTLRVYGTTTISNTFDDAEFVPVVFGYSYYRTPCTMALMDDFTFVGNSVNTNATKFTITENSDSRTMLGRILLEGEINFNIIDGAADVDLELQPQIADDSGAGTLVKRGEGMLLLSAATNTLTGGIRVEQGALGITGLVSSEAAQVSVSADATLYTYQNTQFNGGLHFEDDATLVLDSSAVLQTSAISGEGNMVNVYFDAPDEYDNLITVIRSDTPIEATFVSCVPKWELYKTKNGKEVKCGKPQSTLLIVR